MDFPYLVIVLMVGTDTHICTLSLLGSHFRWIHVSEIGFRKWKHTSSSRKAKRGFLFLQQLVWMRRVHYGHLQNRDSVNQLAHLLSFWLQINPNFKNSVNEFLIHHPSYYLYISFIGQKIFNKWYLLMNTLTIFLLFELIKNIKLTII